MTGALDRLAATLDTLGADRCSVGLWWRDDDLEQPSAALAALLQALGEHGIAPALAAVAGRLLPEAVDALSGTRARLFVHGWTHADHSSPGAKKSEFGPERPIAARLAEIADGRRRLAVLGGGRALPCFVPPWNRLGDDLLGRLAETGVAALSGFAPWGRTAPVADVPRLDTHVDLIDWHGGRVPLDVAAVAAALEDRIRQRFRNESPVDGPIGILSHHRVTNAAAWRAWRPLLVLLAGHPAVRWLDPASALRAVGAEVAEGAEMVGMATDETRRVG